MKRICSIFALLILLVAVAAPAVGNPAPGEKSKAVAGEKSKPDQKEKAKPAQEKVYWLTIKSGIRHNSKCRYYENSKGRPSTKDEGRACKICGG